MDFSIVKLFPDNLMRALCDTLIHSLWQGLILAAVTGCIVIFTRKSPPARRYNLLIAALILFTAATVVTFVMNLRQPAPVSFTAVPAPAADIGNQNIAQLPAQQTDVQKPAFTTVITTFFNRNANVIVLIWFLIVCARSLQLATGLQGIYYLRRKNVTTADAAWQNRVHQLAKSLGIKRLVGIAESGLANVPMVIGHLKPLILMPIGLLTALSTEEIETILIHELAHIRRSDYLVNLLQSFVEIVFFFNPAVLWISVLIRTERENCCDDIVIAQSSSKVDYIKALVSCQEYINVVPSFAMALAGKKNHLKNRVTRIISNNNQSLNRVEKSLLAICLVTAAMFTVAFTNAEKITKLVKKASHIVAKQVPELAKKPLQVNIPAKPVNADSLRQLKLRVYQPNEVDNGTFAKITNSAYSTYLFKDGQKLYQLNYRNRVLASMQVNGKTIAPNKVAEYSDVIDRIHQKSKDELDSDDNASITSPQKNMAGDAGIVFDNNTNNPKVLHKLDSINANIKMQMDEKRAKYSLGKLDGKLNNQSDAAAIDSSIQAYKASHGYVKARVNAADPKAKVYGEYNNDAKALVAAKVPVSPADYRNEADQYNKLQKLKLKDDDRRDLAINDMIKDGLITTRENLSFKMSNLEFIVNGKKQPDAVFQKYKDKYVKAYAKGQGEWSWLYNYDTDAHRESSTTVDSQKN